MSQFIESIRWENGIFHHVDYHIARMNRTVSRSGKLLPEFLSQQLIDQLSDIPLAKIRIIYNHEIEEFTWARYNRIIINSLKIKHHNTIDYSLKSTNREELKNLYKQREEADDILVIKNGFITDTFYHNILFFDGVKWVTPNTPLLEGVQRQHLLEKKIIKEKEIKLIDLSTFQGFKLINALNPFETAPLGLIKNITQ